MVGVQRLPHRKRPSACGVHHRRETGADDEAGVERIADLSGEDKWRKVGGPHGPTPRQLAASAHEPVREGTSASTDLHKRDRRAEYGKQDNASYIAIPSGVSKKGMKKNK